MIPQRSWVLSQAAARSKSQRRLAVEELSRDPWVIFPGNLQGRSVRECGPEGAVLVEVTDGEVGQIRRLIVDAAGWASIEVSLDGIDKEKDVLDAVKNAMAPHAEEAADKLLAMRVTLAGATSLHWRLKSSARRLADEVQAVAHHVGDDIWIERLRINTRDVNETSASADASSFDLPANLEDLAGRPQVLKAREEIDTPEPEAQPSVEVLRCLRIRATARPPSGRTRLSTEPV